MKLLLADPNRDFLKAYHKLLTLEGHAVSVCFEGTETVRALASGQYDAAVINAALPRVSCGQIVALARETDTLTVVLTHKKISAGLLLSEPLANAYLPFPFLPEELVSLLRRVSETAKSDRTLAAGDVSVSVSSFCISGTQVRLTTGEIGVLEALIAVCEAQISGAQVQPAEFGPYINALNAKFARAGKQLRVVYQNREGYRLVTGI